jgi:nucleoside-triphosphatase THEP1
MRPVILFTGPKQSGKTTLLSGMVKTAGGCGGFLSPVVQGERMLQRVAKSEIIPMEYKGEGAFLAVGRFLFSAQAFDQACQWMLDDMLHPDIRALILDEVGPLELRNEGFAYLIRQLLQAMPLDKQLILVVREGLAETVAAHFGIQPAEYETIHIGQGLRAENGYFYTAKLIS